MQGFNYSDLLVCRLQISRLLLAFVGPFPSFITNVKVQQSKNISLDQIRSINSLLMSVPKSSLKSQVSRTISLMLSRSSPRIPSLPRSNNTLKTHLGNDVYSGDSVRACCYFESFQQLFRFLNFVARRFPVSDHPSSICRPGVSLFALYLVWFHT